MPTKTTRSRRARNVRAPNPGSTTSPFDWTIKLVYSDGPTDEEIQLRYGTWGKTRMPIGQTGIFVHAETHELKPRVLVSGVDSPNGFGKPLPVPVKVWGWGTPADQFQVETVGFYLNPDDSIEIGGKSLWLECHKN